MKFKQKLVLFLAGVLSIGIIVPSEVALANESSFLNETTREYSVPKARIYNDFYNAFPEMADTSKKIDCIKELQDFSGNRYYIIEFSPLGYMIYDSTFTMAIEANAEAISPYYGINQGLRYNGAMNYYIEDISQTNDNSYRFDHAILDESIIIDSNAEMELLIESSNNFSVEINKSIVEASQESQGKAKIAPTKTTQTASLSSRSIVTKLDTSGFNLDGRCAWVAAAIIVWYHKKAWGWDNLAPNGWGSNLTDEIRGTRDKTTSLSDVRWALKSYVKSLGGIPDGYAAMDTISPKASTIFERVNSNIPVIIGSGDMEDPSGGKSKLQHAVVVHKVERTAKKNWLGITEYSDYKYWVHFGWNSTETTSYNNVMLNHSSFNIHSRCNFQN